MAHPHTNPPEILANDFLTSYNVWTWASNVRATAIPAGTRSLLFVGHHGYGRYGYGTPTSDPSLHNTPAPGNWKYIYDPAWTSGNGEHAYPYRYQMWAYDLTQVQEVLSGTRQPFSCTPTVIPIDFPFDGTRGFAAPDPDPDKRYVRGGCYLPDRRLFLVATGQRGFPFRSVIHAIRITNATAA